MVWGEKLDLRARADEFAEITDEDILDPIE